MPLPIVIGGLAILLGGAGAKKALDAHRINEEAKRINQEAQDMVDKARKNLEGSRNRAATSLTQLGQEKVDILQNDMVPFVNLMKKIKNVNMTEISNMGDLSKMQVNEGTLAEMEDMGSLAVKMASGFVEGAAGGALLAFGAYSTVAYLGTAGTGAAIAGLSGAAATNATLAYLGGGTLAAGGLGMAGGAVVLGGVVAAPLLFVMGSAMKSKAKENLENAKSNKAKAEAAAKEMGLASDACEKISERADMFTDLLQNIHTKFHGLIDQMKDVMIDNGTDYGNYNQDAKNILAMAWSLAAATKAVLDTPILNEDGAVTTKSLDVHCEISQKIAKVNA